MKSLIYLNGVVSSAEEARVSVMDRGFLFGDGVYEAGRSYQRVFLFLEEHWERFESSAKKLALPFPFRHGELTDQLFAVAKKADVSNVSFRSILTRGPISTVGLGTFEEVEPTICHILYELNETGLERGWREGVVLQTSTVVRNSSKAQDPNIKTSNYLNSLLAHQDVQKRGGGEAILCNHEGQVTEGTNFSIFGITQDNVLITPHLAIGILDSITRRHILQASHGLRCEEGFYCLKEFKQCKEVFIASSTREVMPVKKWDECEYDDFSQSQKVRDALLKIIHAYLESHPRY